MTTRRPPPPYRIGRPDPAPWWLAPLLAIGALGSLTIAGLLVWAVVEVLAATTAGAR
jgi:hypothetical protein